MWTRFRRSVTAPLRIAAQISRLQQLIEEQNNLLRELIQSSTGRPSRTPRRSAALPAESELPPSAARKTGTTTRRRTGSDVWTSTPPRSPQEEDESLRESQATAPEPFPPNGDGTPKTGDPHDVQ